MRRRKGFTLVELMVAMALTIFIMVILTQAFVLSIDTFVGLKGIGDMQENLRTGANMLRFDLAQNHFEAMRRTSDPNFNTPPPREGFLTINMDGVTIDGNTTNTLFPPPQKKAPYFIVINGVYNNIYPGMSITTNMGYSDVVIATQAGTPPGKTTLQVANPPPPFPPLVPVLFTQSEGMDLDGMPSTLSTFGTLHMACRLKGNRQESFYSTPIVDVPPPQGLPSFFAQQTFYNLNPMTEDADATLRIPLAGPFYRSQWGEVVYFLGSTDPNNPGPFQPTGTTEEPLNPFSTSGTPLYTLYRAQWVAVTDNTAVNNVQNTSVNPATVGYPATLLQTNNWGGLACNPGNPQNPSALFFYTPTDLAQGNRTFSSTNMARAFMTPPTMVVPNVISWQVQSITTGGPPQETFYDSTAPTFSLRGVAITIRVWDNKTRQTRQLTIVQDL